MRLNSALVTVAGVLSALMVPRALVGSDPQKVQNPIVWADVPDLAVVRVGNAYYMSSTTMHLAPGLPIMKSEDLVNWKLVSYAYDTLADNEALRLENGKNAYGAGSWASSLRHHDGVFYVSTFSSTTNRTHVYTTRDPEKGPWKESSFSPSLHDHSLFFDDDGRVYMIYGGGDLRLIELTPDASAIKPGGLHQVIIPNASAVAGPNIGLPAEGSHLRKIDGRYYVFNITWPKQGMRTQLVHRADVITGPYEGRVALMDKGVAQGGMIDTPEGDWFALLFRDRGAVGRVPWLVPLRWEDGWPVLGDSGIAPEEILLRAEAQSLGNLVTTDDFTRSSGEEDFALAWQWNHNPDSRFWSLKERPGYLRLTTGRVDGSLVEARNTLTQRTFGPESTATVALDVSRMKTGDQAGLAVLQKLYGFVGVKQEDTGPRVVMVGVETDTPMEHESVPLQGSVVHLRIACDFKDMKDVATFHYSVDGTDWKQIGAPLQMKYTLPHFMGYRFGLFNFATRETGGSVDFDYYRITPAR